MSKSVRSIGLAISIEKSTEQLAEFRHTPDLVRTFSEENGGLNHVLRQAKPSTYMTTYIVLIK